MFSVAYNPATQITSLYSVNAALDTLDAHKPVVAVGSGIVVFSTSESIAGYYLDLTNPNIVVGILADSSRETNGAALVVDDVLIINTGGSSLSGDNVSGVPTFDTPLRKTNCTL